MSIQKLWICEKPSVARLVASCLPAPHKNIDGAIEVDGGKQVVTWCVGHILETFMPDDYKDKNWKVWRYEDLPIIPDKWMLKPKEAVKKQVSIVEKLISKSERFVNVGDPDREGQFLVDEVLYYFNVNPKKVERLLVNTQQKSGVKKALKEMKDNTSFKPTYEAGIGRQQADWLIGMNGSRAATLKARENQFYGVVTVGRVQTPVLSLIVKRDLDIENFVPVDYFNFNALLNKDGKDFKARWVPQGTTLEAINKAEEIEKLENANEEETDEENEVSEDKNNKPAWLDDNNRLIDKNVAQQIFDKIKAEKTCVVTNYEKNTKNETRPKLFNLTELQKAMGKLGFSLDKTNETAQKLYEKTFLTYPRASARLLPVKLKADTLPSILKNLGDMEEYASFVEQCDIDRKNNIWDLEGVETESHHAIIPTDNPNVDSLNADERLMYDVVAKQFLASFMPDCVADLAKIDISIKDEKFSLTGKVIKQEGWRVLFAKDNSSKSKSKKETVEELPNLSLNDVLDINKIEMTENKTTPPNYFLEAEMPYIMEKVYLTITDPLMRKELKNIGGLGTEATRGGIISELKRRKFVYTEGKLLKSTELGRNIIAALPEILKDPVFTARQEADLKSIERKKMSLVDFQNKQKELIKGLMEVLRDSDFSGFTGLESNTENKGKKTAPIKSKGKCPKCGGDLIEKTVGAGKKTKAGTKFIGCSNYSTKGCNYTKWD